MLSRVRQFVTLRQLLVQLLPKLRVLDEEFTRHGALGEQVTELSGPAVAFDVHQLLVVGHQVAKLYAAVASSVLDELAIH
ncbi:hypothetical protein D3C73_1419640 [compost metagenome]